MCDQNNDCDSSRDWDAEFEEADSQDPHRDDPPCYANLDERIE